MIVYISYDIFVQKVWDHSCHSWRDHHPKGGFLHRDSTQNLGENMGYTMEVEAVNRDIYVYIYVYIYMYICIYIYMGYTISKMGDEAVNIEVELRLTATACVATRSA